MGALPNIVVVMSDQHRADLLGCAGQPVVQTPAIDRLAAEGVRFSSVNCQGPLCMPARASFLTERYVRDHGVYTNWAEVAAETPTYLWSLRETGYHTALVGKAHLYRDETVSAHVADLAPRLQGLGFSEVHETGDKFATSPNPYTDDLARRDLLAAYQQHIADRSYQGENETGRGATKRVPMWDSTPMPLPLDAYIDAWHGERAADWLREYDADSPFFLFVGFPGPHDPWDAPEQARRRYAGVEPPMPASTQRPDLTGTGNYGRLLKAFLHLSDSDTMTDQAIAGMRVAYCADVSVIDDAVGRIVAALEQRGLLDNTWVIYTSDHGEMGGNHGLMSKCVLYAPAVRVPLVIRPPGGRVAAVVDDLVEHMDVAATVRAVAGAPVLPHSDGRSLLGYVTHGTTPEPREHSVSENWGFASFETRRHKLVVDEDACAPCQLFDRMEDPNEDVNLLADPAYTDVVDELMTTLVRPFFETTPARPHPSPFTG
ncbi:MAG: sulfatase [Actinomycetes bacterium]